MGEVKKIEMEDEMQKSTSRLLRKKQGGLRTMPFIFSNEISEKLAVVGFSTNMLTYLTQQLHMPLTKAATTLTNFSGTASLTPLVGAFLADAYIGRFWTITVGSIIYQIGMISLTVSAVLPNFRPPPCTTGHNCEEAAQWQLAVLYASLLLTALGSGGIRPCVVAFGADQFDESDPNERTKTWNFFNWYYFCMGFAMLLAVTVVVYIQDNIGWGWGLGIPTIAMGLSVVSFIAGYPLYRRLEPAGSPFTRLAQVIVAAVRKRKLAMVEDHKCLYKNDELDAAISLSGKLQHTSHFRFLDKAAILTDKDDVNKPSFSPSQKPNPWRLSTVHRVEELKSIIRMGPIWSTGILVITAAAQQNTFSLQQARSMDRRLVPSSTFLIPPGSMTVFTMLAMLVTIAFYDRLLVPILRPRGFSFLHRMGAGMAVSTTATFVAGFVEFQRKRHSLLATPPMSVLWLVPQYALHGVAEALMSIGHLEFFYDQAPESMRSTATALYWTSISAGSYVSTMLVSVVHRWGSWLPDDLNKGRLEYFYWLITVLQVANLVYYGVCAKFYTFKPVELRGKGKDCEVVELTSSKV